MKRGIAWTAVAVAAAVTTTGLAALDVGIGVVAGVVALALCYPLLLRRVLFRGERLPHRTRWLFLGGWALFLVAGVCATDAGMFVLGTAGTATVTDENRYLGNHGTPYLECDVDQPDGENNELRPSGRCPKPPGSRIPIVYTSTDDVLRPVAGTRGDLVPRTAVWAVANLAGAGLLVASARVRSRPGLRG